MKHWKALSETSLSKLEYIVILVNGEQANNQEIGKQG